MTTIRHISENEIPMSLLLHADPSEACIHKYLHKAKCFGALSGTTLIGACVTNSNEEGVWEIFNIVVIPEKQQQGIGTELLKFVIKHFDHAGAQRLELGTGTFGYQLMFYQRLGFRVTRIVKNFFIDNYPEPVYDQGLQLQDMLRLSYEFPKNTQRITE